MNNRLRYLLNRIRERLWVKPLIVCVLSIGGAFLARLADQSGVGDYVPEVTLKSIETLLSIMSASMLVIATFAVASMVAAYSSASSTATPRTFSLVIADDVSQNALSAFIGAFIFSIVSLVAIQNSYYEQAGRFALFVLTIAVFAIVIFTFVRWVDRVARLGRMGTTISKVEVATDSAMHQRLAAPTLGGVAVGSFQGHSVELFSPVVGYVKRVDVSDLQKQAEASELHIEVTALPGTFAAPGRPLARIYATPGSDVEIDLDAMSKAFLIGRDRTFDEDPRFGLIVLSEIASRALSPAINDPGTAIDVIGTLVRLFVDWGSPRTEALPEARYPRVAVPELNLDNMFEDAFNPIARDGAGTIEVVVRLLKALESLASVEDAGMRATARRHARRVVARAELVLKFENDLTTARTFAAFASQPTGE